MAAAETRDLWRKTRVWLGTYDTLVMDAMAYDRAAQALRLPLAQAAPGYGGATDAALLVVIHSTAKSRAAVLLWHMEVGDEVAARALLHLSVDVRRRHARRASGRQRHGGDVT
jgi:hypothetical protein